MVKPDARIWGFYRVQCFSDFKMLKLTLGVMSHVTIHQTVFCAHLSFFCVIS